jgi:hypothetical protein
LGLIKSANDRTNQIRISPLVKQVKGVRDKIRNLQQPCLAHASEVGDIAEVSEDSPPCTPSPEVCDPHALTLLESPLGEHKQPTLTDFFVMEPAHQEYVKAPTNLFRGTQDRRFTVEGVRFLNDRAEEN